MKKILKISLESPYIILCTFNNGDHRKLDLEKVLDTEHKYAKKVFNDKVFREVKVGSNGELYWEDIAEMKMLDGRIIPCAFDISPEFAYFNSEPIAVVSA